MNEGLTGLERHESEPLMTEFFERTNPLIYTATKNISVYKLKWSYI